MSDHVAAHARGHLYGNHAEPYNPLNPSNKGRNPRVVDDEGHPIASRLKPGGAPLYYGDGRPMTTPGGEPVRASGSVRLNYGMRLERDGRTYFMAWQVNHGDPKEDAAHNATGWVDADDMTEDGAATARALIPHRLGSVEQPLARDADGHPRLFVVNGVNERARDAVRLGLTYVGVTGHHHDRVANFFNLHDGRAGLQMLVNLPDVPGGGIAADCFPNGTPFAAAADAHGDPITVGIPVFDQQGGQQVLTFLYGKAGETRGWMVKDWLDEIPRPEGS